MNNVYLSGTLERIINTKTVNTKNGNKTVTIFTLKCTEDKNSEYIKCEAWDASAEIIANLQVGSFVFGFGRIKNNSWQDKTTNKTVYDTVVAVKHLAKLDIRAVKKNDVVPAVQDAVATQQAPQQVQQPVQQAVQQVPQYVQQPQNQNVVPESVTSNEIPF